MDPRTIGTVVGAAIARDTLADELPREWMGLDPQDADQLIAAGILPNSVAWHDAEQSAKAEYLRIIGGK